MHLYAQENPSYHEGGYLHIPNIGAPNQSVFYHNALLRFDPTIDAWRLDGVETARITDDRIKHIELIVTESLPIQVYLLMSIQLRHSCGDRYIINERKSDKNKFEIAVGFYNRSSEEIPCDDEDKTIDIAHPLKVFGLVAGIYEYVINGAHTGSFELKSDNFLPESWMKAIDHLP